MRYTWRADLSGPPMANLSSERCFLFNGRRPAKRPAQGKKVRLHRGQTAGRRFWPVLPPPRLPRPAWPAGSPRNIAGAISLRPTPATSWSVHRCGVAALLRSARSSSMPSWKFRQLCDPDLAHLETWRRNFAACTRKSRLHKARLAPRIWPWLSKQCGVQGVHIRREGPPASGWSLIFALADRCRWCRRGSASRTQAGKCPRG